MIQIKKAGDEPAFCRAPADYFLSIGPFSAAWGIALPGLPGAGVGAAEPVAPVSGAGAPPGAAIPPGVPASDFIASDFIASPDIGEGVGAGVGAATGALGAGGGGVVTFVSSFLLQAVRPTATRAATRSERFIFFPFRRTSAVGYEIRTAGHAAYAA